MDATAFASWRAGVGLLDRTQRSLLRQDLVLAEAADPIDQPGAEGAAIPAERAAATASVAIGMTADPAPGFDRANRSGPDRPPWLSTLRRR